MSEEILNLSTKLKEKRVRLDDNNVYVLKELTIEKKEAWMQSQRQRHEVIDGMSVVKDFKGYMTELVVRCMFLITPDNRELPVDPKVVATWSQSCVEKLHEHCQILNAVSQEGVEEAKKG